MRDPSSAVFALWQELMRTGEMFGENKPVGRITVGKNRIIPHESGKPGPWRNVLFEQKSQVELGFVKSINITRPVDQDAATATIVLFNDQMMPGAFSPQGIDTGIGRPGYRSPTRGQAPAINTASVYGDQAQFPTDWDYPSPGDEPGSGAGTWTHPNGQTFNNFRAYDGGSGEFSGSDAAHNLALLIPNRVVRTFQGYGSDNFDANNEHYLPGDSGYVHPSDDAKLVQTGVWMIDRVVFGTDGYITLECRDLAKVLLEQFVYPPMVPLERFPLIYCPEREWTETVTTGPGTPGANLASGLGAPSGQFETGNDVHFGARATVHGHHPFDAFDGHLDTYFLSVGNVSPTASFAYEYVTAVTNGATVNQVIVNTVSKGYVLYVSVYEDGAWKGSNTIPYYDFPDFPNKANIRYVSKHNITSDGDNIFTLPREYQASHVRVTFHKLWNSGIGPYVYRLGLRKFEVRHRPPSTTQTVTRNNFNDPGVSQDWSQVIRELLGWAGFTWYANPALYPGVSSDPLIGNANDGAPLRIWGDIEWLGAGPIICTAPEFFVNKSFMEAINLVVQMIGAVFFIDESGGAIFRMPNIWSAGNFLTGAPDPTQLFGDARVDSNQFNYYMPEMWPIEFHENANLITYQVGLDDSSVRSEILVVGEHPDTSAPGIVAGGYVLGTNPLSGESSAVDFDEVLAGQTRLFLVPGDDTKNFTTIEECQRMAELTAIKILFTYRSGMLKSPCHPGLQIDDQVRIFERISHEFNVHYVSAITTNMDLDSGEWTMDVTTHWLGDDPRDINNWFLNQIQLTPAVSSLPAIEQRLSEAQQPI